MKFVTASIFCLLFCSYLSNAQKNNIIVKSGQTYNEAISPDVRYQYPQFVSGAVYFKDGTASAASLNYNYLLGEIQFINTKNDTLSIDNEEMIKNIIVNNDTFYYYKGYLKSVVGQPLVKLAKSEKLKLGDTKKIGAYGQASSGAAITTISSMYTRSGVSALNQKEDLLLVKETTFYIGDAYNHFLPANKRNVMKLFGRKESLIESYLKENNVRFNNEEDLKSLINYLQKIL